MYLCAFGLDHERQSFSLINLNRRPIWFSDIRFLYPDDTHLHPGFVFGFFSDQDC